MTITEFHRMAVAALAAEPDKVILKDLAKQAQQLSDMVGWADGVIDRDGRVSEAFLQLQAQARLQHEATSDENVAILHDSLGDLLAAIFRHDEDLTPSSNAGDDGVDI
jgi:hypothetical protein